MTLKADSKKRVLVPDARPGDVFDYENHGNGHFHLVRLNKPRSQPKMTKSEVLRAIDGWKSEPTMAWDEMRKLTREP